MLKKPEPNLTNLKIWFSRLPTWSGSSLERLLRPWPSGQRPMVGPSSSRPRTVASFTTPDPQRKGFKAFLFFYKKIPKCFCNVWAKFRFKKFKMPRHLSDCDVSPKEEKSNMKDDLFMAICKNLQKWGKERSKYIWKKKLWAIFVELREF